MNLVEVDDETQQVEIQRSKRQVEDLARGLHNHQRGSGEAINQRNGVAARVRFAAPVAPGRDGRDTALSMQHHDYFRLIARFSRFVRRLGINPYRRPFVYAGFDLAFVLNHLLLKGAWRPQGRAAYVGLYLALVDAYRRQVDWEPWPELEYRTATLLPALMLARVDGKSPVEYLDDVARVPVRAFARTLLTDPQSSLAAVAARWTRQ